MSTPPSSVFLYFKLNHMENNDLSSFEKTGIVLILTIAVLLLFGTLVSCNNKSSAKVFIPKNTYYTNK